MLKKKKLIYGAIGIVAFIFILFFTLRDSSAPETVVANSNDLVRTVKISGKVVPQEKVDLSFEISGTVSSVSKKVSDPVVAGEVLVRLNAGGISAEVAKAQAELASAQAELSKLNGKDIYENSIANAKRSLVQTLRAAYTAASDALNNKADQVFINTFSNRPEISGWFKGFNDLRSSLTSQRIDMGYTMLDWQKMISKLGTTNYSDTELNLTKEYLEKTTSFISDVSVAVNMFEATDPMPQTDIDKYKTAILSARDNLNAASQNLIDSENALTKLLTDVPVQVARVAAAEAALANLQFKLNNTAIVSPINGVVSRQEAKPGQAVTANTSLVSVISRDYEIETFVPELLIAGIQVGNSAKVTLDTYGVAEIFEARVEHLDPAETIKDGVSTYKVALSFLNPDVRIKSGMTANVEIETFRKAGSVVVPMRAVTTEDGQHFVTIVDGKSERKIQVTIGEKDSQGNVEILSGLNSTDKVVINPTTK